MDHLLTLDGRIAMYVVTADQKSSRTTTDAVPVLLTTLNGPAYSAGILRPFERTAGDEVQALFEDATTVVDVAVQLLRAGTWWIGVGVGPVEQPLPATARAGRGPAYLAARAAVEGAKGVPASIGIGGLSGAERAEAAAWLLAALLSRRTQEGWEVVDLMAGGVKQVDVAAKLGISPQAVSRRLRVAGWAEERRGRELLVWLLEQSDRPAPVGRSRTDEEPE
jgi:hypothetical protein